MDNNSFAPIEDAPLHEPTAPLCVLSSLNDRLTMQLDCGFNLNDNRCKDDQTSADVKVTRGGKSSSNGAMTYAFTKR
jgi:hypothetical protein